jgi:hypothetical protein
VSLLPSEKVIGHTNIEGSGARGFVPTSIRFRAAGDTYFRLSWSYGISMPIGVPNSTSRSSPGGNGCLPGLFLCRGSLSLRPVEMGSVSGSGPLTP